MRALVSSAYKQPLRLVEVPEPQVGPQDVLVQVAAAGLNHLDERLRLGEFKAIVPYSTPLQLGHDVAGTVVSVGRDVTAFSAGDQVFARVRDGRIGTFAERISIDAADVALKPSSVSMVEAASMPLVALTAWQALVERGGLKPEQKVLIHAGAGGVGAVAIQLAKQLGATVATTVSARNVQAARDLGADVVIDYGSQDFTEHVRDYDLVLDSLGGDNLKRSLGVLRPGGTVIGIAGPPDPAFAKRMGARFPVTTVIALTSSAIRRAAKKAGVTYEFLWMHASGEQLAQIAALVDAGVVKPSAPRIVSLEQIPEALGSLGAGRTVGVADAS